MGRLWEAFKLGRSLPKEKQAFGQPMGILKCRWCQKRLKVGAAVCHHCGRDQHPEPAGPAGDVPSNPDAVREIAARLEAAGMTSKVDRLKSTAAAMELVHAGASVEEAVAAVTGEGG